MSTKRRKRPGSRIRVAAAALSGRIYAGTLTADQDAFKGDKQDVTSDAIKAVIDHILRVGGASIITEDGRERYRVVVEDLKAGSDAAERSES